MKLFDSHVMIGEYPFRRVDGCDAASVYALLGSGGVERALVSSLPAVFHRDAMEENRRLLREIEDYPGFFLPAAVLNPSYPGWREDAGECLRLGFRAVRLYPAQHGYFLGDVQGVGMLKFAAENNMIVSVPASIENPLQRHRLDADRFIMEPELIDAVRAVPEAVILFHHAATHLYAKAMSEAQLGFAPNVYYDFQRVDFMAQQAMKQLFEYAGAGRVIFGTGCPLHVPDVQFVKMALWDRFSSESPEGAAWGNLSSLVS